MSVKYKIRNQRGLYFMTCTLTGWVDLFSRKVYRDILIDSWRYCQEKKGFQVHAYTIMPNHVHLIVSCRAPFLLEDVTRDWKAFTARMIVDYLENKTNIESRREWLLYLFSYFAVGRKGKQKYQIWQHDNHPVQLYSEGVIQQKLDYIHLNPVRACFVEKAEDWKYSSAPYYSWFREGMIWEFEPVLEVIPVWKWYFEEGPGSV